MKLNIPDNFIQQSIKPIPRQAGSSGKYYKMYQRTTSILLCSYNAKINAISLNIKYFIIKF